MEFLKIADPDAPGDYLVLAKRDFDPAVHTLFASPAASPGVTSEPATSTAFVGDSPTTPAAVNIATLTVAEAAPFIEAAATPEALQAFQAQEAARTPPRAGVLKALAAKLAVLTAQG